MVIFIISAEETIRIANPCSVNRVGDAALHYKPAGGTMPLPINVIQGEGMDESFVTTALPEAPFFLSEGQSARRPQKVPNIFMSRTFCGETEIRTRETLWEFTRFPGVPLKPLEHLSSNQ